MERPIKISHHESTLRLYLIKDPTGHAVIAHYRPKHLRMLYGKDIDITYLGLAAPALKPGLILRTYTNEHPRKLHSANSRRNRFGPAAEMARRNHYVLAS